VSVLPVAARPVLVTVSGMVGSGKTTALLQILSTLQQQGVRAEPWRFRTLPCFTLGASRQRKAEGDTRAATEVRGRGYSRKKLDLKTTVGYVARMVAFRVYRRWPGHAAWAVCNRYFYDNLAHFDFDAPAARFYAAVLRLCMPRPDLAVLLVASPSTIAARRPQYAEDYLTRVGDAYRQVARMFPELVVLHSEPGADTSERLDQLVRSRLRPTETV